MRFGLTILPDESWAETEPRWRAAEELGFDHAWTYDHLVWGGLPEQPWRGTMPTLTAAAMVTERIRLGTFVTSPNFRHPYVLHRDAQALEDISGGRFLLAVGTGGDLDSRILASADQEELSVRERVARFREYAELLVRLRDEDHVTSTGRWFSTQDARTLPALTRTPLILAGNGPRSVSFAARRGDGWVTTGPMGTSTLDAWWAGLAEATATLEGALVEAGKDPADFPRYLNLDSAPVFSLESVDVFAEQTGRAAELGFTDVVTHWPREGRPTDEPYVGRVATLEQVAADVLPDLRG